MHLVSRLKFLFDNIFSIGELTNSTKVMLVYDKRDNTNSVIILANKK